MARMLEAYLAFARGDSGEQSAPTDMAAFLEELKADAERNGHQARASCSTASRSSPCGRRRSSAAWPIWCRTRRALRRSIAITGHRDHRYLTVTVDDDGPGIPADMREDVFKPFVRLDDARNQDEGGTGLGLAIARDIARSHGGDIMLERQPARRPARDGAGAGLRNWFFVSDRMPYGADPAMQARWYRLNPPDNLVVGLPIALAIGVRLRAVRPVVGQLDGASSAMTPWRARAALRRARRAVDGARRQPRHVLRRQGGALRRPRQRAAARASIPGRAQVAVRVDGAAGRTPIASPSARGSGTSGSRAPRPPKRRRRSRAIPSCTRPSSGS